MLILLVRHVIMFLRQEMIHGFWRRFTIPYVLYRVMFESEAFFLLFVCALNVPTISNGLKINKQGFKIIKCFFFVTYTYLYHANYYFLFFLII